MLFVGERNTDEPAKIGQIWLDSNQLGTGFCNYPVLAGKESLQKPLRPI
jgi:hypothetical protein